MRVDYSPAEVWQEEGVEASPSQNLDPLKGASTRGPRGSGGVASDLRRITSLPVEENGKPGTLAQSRGVGRSADELDLQVFGLSLNPAQGGGSDLSLFPAFLWSSFRQSTAVGSSALDPRALGGSLSLTPWTESVLREPGGSVSPGRWRVHQLASGLGQLQSAAGYGLPGRLAVQAGWLSGPARGAAGSLSADLGALLGGFKFQLLAVSQDVATDGTRSFPTPGARQKTDRLIPVLQWDVPLRSQTLLKVSAFGDAQNLRLTEASGALQSDDQSRQAGFQAVLLGDAGRVLVGARKATYRGVGFDSPAETLGRVRVVPALHRWLSLPRERDRLEPELSLLSVSGLRPAWGAALGARSGSENGLSAFARISSEPRLPSLMDRFASYPGFSGNPGLSPERAWTLSSGLVLTPGTESPELRAPGAPGSDSWTYGLKGLIQLRQDAQIASYPGTVENRGWARLRSLQGSAERRWRSHGMLPSGFVRAEGTVTRSRVEEVSASFPLVPELSFRGTFGLEPLGGKTPWEILLLTQMAGARSTSLSASAGTLPGYALWDLQSRLSFGDRWVMSASIENLFDRPVELLAADPLPGRSVSFALTGEF